MTDKKQSESSAAEFDIKHRVTGAAVLLFVGALLIPWLLGPPSEASKRLETIAEDNLGDSTPASEIERELLAETSQMPVDIEETVYISKITPLDSGGVRQSDEVESDPKKPDNLEASAPVEKSSDTPPAVPEKKAVVDKQADEKKAAEKEQRRVAAAAAKKKAEEAQQADQKKREQALQAALAAESQTAAVDVGWVVQVGLYLEEKGAESKMDELRRKGFRPDSTIVDTNRGPKTGTRVWLGPFEKRTAAEQQNKLLREQTGKDGFIRVYP